MIPLSVANPLAGFEPGSFNGFRRDLPRLRFGFSHILRLIHFHGAIAIKHICSMIHLIFKCVNHDQAPAPTYGFGVSGGVMLGDPMAFQGSGDTAGSSPDSCAKNSRG
jgi:hypothetical protein